MVDDEEREARSDEGREEKSEHTQVSLGGNRSWYLPISNIQTIYDCPQCNSHVTTEAGSRINYGGTGASTISK